MSLGVALYWTLLNATTLPPLTCRNSDTLTEGTAMNLTIEQLRDMHYTASLAECRLIERLNKTSKWNVMERRHIARQIKNMRTHQVMLSRMILIKSGLPIDTLALDWS